MKKKILLIEDHSDLREATAELLQFYGYEVLLADNGLLGLTIAASQFPALILSDLRMPGMSGYELFERLQEDMRTAAIPVILTSANFNRNTVAYKEYPGVATCLAKPFDEDGLLNAIDIALK